jgi:hypothetical protein
LARWGRKRWPWERLVWSIVYDLTRYFATFLRQAGIGDGLTHNSGINQLLPTRQTRPSALRCEVPAPRRKSPITPRTRNPSRDAKRRSDGRHVPPTAVAARAAPGPSAAVAHPATLARQAADDDVEEGEDAIDDDEDDGGDGMDDTHEDGADGAEDGLDLRGGQWMRLNWLRGAYAGDDGAHFW